jgi:MFS family permease
MSVNAIGLLRKRSFLPLFLTQFFGAFNDNAFKFAMLTLISYHLSSSQLESERLQALAGALFILPFFFLSATAGQLADKFNKADVTRVIKFFEMLLMVMGGFALYYSSTLFLMLTLTGLGIHSSFFGPIKYAILPDHLPKPQLMGATALIEASTFVAILLGTIFGTMSVVGSRTGSLGAVLMTTIVAMAGFAASLFILPARSEVGELKVDWNVWRSTKDMLCEVIVDPRIMPVICVISWFWLVGAVILTKMPDYTNYILRADTSVFSLFLALFSLGIALGSMAILRILSGKITLRLVPHGMLLLSFFAADLYWATPVYIDKYAPLQPFVAFFDNISHWRFAIDFFCLSFSGGLFVVPLYTYLQVVSNKGSCARTIAANNIVNALFMVLGSGLVTLLLHFHIAMAFVFFILAVLNAIAAVLFWWFFLKNQSAEKLVL